MGTRKKGSPVYGAWKMMPVCAQTNCSRSFTFWGKVVEKGVGGEQDLERLAVHNPYTPHR